MEWSVSFRPFASKSRGVVLASSVLYALVLPVVYRYYMFPLFPDTDFVLVRGSYLEIALFSAISVLPALWLSTALSRPSELLAWLLYVLLYVPNVVTAPLMGSPGTFPSRLTMSLVLLGSMAIVSLPNQFSAPKLALPRVRPFVYWLAISACAGLLMGVVIHQYGLHLRFANFLHVYDARAEFSAQATLLIGYSVRWLGKVIGPILLAYGLLYRKPIPICAGIALALFVYSVAAFKGILLGPILVLGITVLALFFAKRFGAALIACVLAVIGVSIVVYEWYGSTVLLGKFVARTIYQPAQLGQLYFDFFSSHPVTLMSESAFNPITTYPYHEAIPYLIATTYFGQHFDANAHLWAVAMADFGYVGPLIISGVLAAILWLIDGLALKKGLVFCCSSLVVALFSVINGALQTALLSDGIALAMILVGLFPISDLASTPERSPSLLPGVFPQRRGATWT